MVLDLDRLIDAVERYDEGDLVVQEALHLKKSEVTKLGIAEVESMFLRYVAWRRRNPSGDESSQGANSIRRRKTPPFPGMKVLKQGWIEELGTALSRRVVEARVAQIFGADRQRLQGLETRAREIWSTATNARG